MPTSVVITTGVILDSTADLLKILQNNESLPERSADLIEELLGFHQALDSFAVIIGFSEEIQAYLVNCCDLCLQLKRQILRGDVFNPVMSVAIHMLRVCRMATLIDFYWKILYVYPPNSATGLN